MAATRRPSDASGLAQASIVGLEHGVCPHANESGHVEHAPHIGSAACDHPAPAQLAAVAIDRRNAHERRDLTAIKFAQLRQSRNERPRGLVADARHAFQKLLLFAPAGVSRTRLPMS